MTGKDTDLKREFHYYLEHQDELVEKYDGKVIAIKDGQVLGAFDSDIEAIREISKEHEVGTFLVQLCTPGSDAYSQTFHSRVCFA